MFSFRAATSADFEWLYQLKQATLRGYVEQTWGRWDELEQRRRFSDAFRPESLKVILCDGRDIGVMDLQKKSGDFFLADLALTPDRQRQGLGRQLIGGILQQARAAKKSVRLQALKVNPAQHLYTRLGFVVTGETATHLIMHHPPTE